MGKATDKDHLAEFGKNLKRIRTKKKLSYRKLSQMCEVDYSDISKMEKGMINLTLLTIIELAKGLEVHPKELMDVEFE